MPRRLSPPPLDPFPPLPLPGQAGLSTSQPRTYASIVAASTTRSESRLTDLAETSTPPSAIITTLSSSSVPSSSPVISSPVQRITRSSENDGWSADDVDRDPALDDINIAYPPIAPHQTSWGQNLDVAVEATPISSNEGVTNTAASHSSDAGQETTLASNNGPTLAPFLSLEDILGTPRPPASSPSQTSQEARRIRQNQNPTRNTSFRYTLNSNPTEWGNIEPAEERYGNRTSYDSWRWYSTSALMNDGPARNENPGTLISSRPWTSRFADGVPARARVRLTEQERHGNEERELRLLREASVTNGVVGDIGQTGSESQTTGREAGSIASQIPPPSTSRRNIPREPLMTSGSLDAEGPNMPRPSISNLTNTDPRRRSGDWTTNFINDLPPSIRYRQRNIPLGPEDVIRSTWRQPLRMPSLRQPLRVSDAELEEGMENLDSSEDSEWATSPRRGLYTHPNITGVLESESDILADGFNRSMMGDDGEAVMSGGSNLRRGGFNRRRDTLLRAEAQGDSGSFMASSGEDHLGSSEMGVRDLEDGGTRRQGLTATNMEVQRSVQPIVVRSAENLSQLNPSTLRRREIYDDGDDVRQADHSARRDTTSQNSKRRKLVPMFSAPAVEQFRPAYVAFSSLDPSTPLPGLFDLPQAGSHLALSSNVQTTPEFKSALRTADGQIESSSESMPYRTQIITYLPNPHPLHTDDDSSSLRTIHPIPIEIGVHYFEVEVLNAGSEGLMSVGWMSHNSNLRRLVGWDKGSWGFHSDDGRCFDGRGLGDAYGESWGLGVVVGCGVDFTLGRAFFTRNGVLIRHCFSNLGKGLYPAVGLKSSNESLSVNFTGPFQFDIEGYCERVRDIAWFAATAPVNEIQMVPRLADQYISGKLEPARTATSGARTTEKADCIKNTYLTGHSTLESSKNDRSVRECHKVTRNVIERTTAAFVLDYLKHHGYSNTLASTRRTMVARGWLEDASASTVQNSHGRGLAADTPSDPVDDKSTQLVQRNQLAPWSISTPKDCCQLDSPYTVLRHIHDRVVKSDTLRIPWDLISAIDPTFASAEPQVIIPLKRRLIVYDLINLIRQSKFNIATKPLPELVSQHQAPDNVDKLMSVVRDDNADRDTEVIALGTSLSLLSKVESWSEDEVRDLELAFGLLGRPASQWDEKEVPMVGFKKRQEDANQLDKQLRHAMGSKSRSYLQQALCQTILVQKVLMGSHAPEATYLDPKRLLRIGYTTLC